ncbi:MAG TPA: gliding motility-associated C-terminal domain-containing protein, partial [Bacteroidales bacterium]|nr:gliding motility-associated C-terminal domain-containing protein [Bacteroidales bacterium]
IFKWEISNGICPIVFDKVIIELNKLFVPEGFSPNGDGINDYFVINGMEPNDNYSLQIFDRWGNMVYSSDAYQNNWQGKDVNENQLPDDTYFYLLKKQDKVKRSGYIVLKR